MIVLNLTIGVGSVEDKDEWTYQSVGEVRLNDHVIFATEPLPGFNDRRVVEETLEQFTTALTRALELAQQ